MIYENLNETELRDIAKKRLEAKAGLRSNIITYIIVNIGLFVIYTLTNWGGYPWFIWPLFGWGIGVIFHVLKVSSVLRNTAGNEIEREIERIRNSR